MLNNLLQLLQLTRGQPQYGYLLSGVPKEKLSDLAQHHYLVTFIAWHLARLCNLKGAQLSTLKVVEISLVHDLGELFGGDINWFYARQNPEARKAAKAFEEENNKYLAKLFAADQQHFEVLITKDDSDEYRIAKLADYMECLQFKHYVGALNWELDSAALIGIEGVVRELKDPLVKKTISEFVEKWKREIGGE